MRHTKIVATLGPATSDDATLDALIRAGVDVVRLNFSHGTHETHRVTYARARAAAARAGREVAILQDLSGPKMRTGRLEGGRAIELREGDSFVIATGEFVGGPGRVSTPYAELARSVSAGDRILLDDGRPGQSRLEILGDDQGAKQAPLIRSFTSVPTTASNTSSRSSR